jgi:hypothetical protein
VRGGGGERGSIDCNREGKRDTLARKKINEREDKH